MELGGDREFRYRVAASYFLSSALFILLALAGPLTVASALLAGRVGGWAVLAPLPSWLVALQLLPILLALSGVYDVTMNALSRRRGLVLATRVGITARDWLGHEGRMFWDEVEELRAGQVLAFGKRTSIPNAAFELRGGGKMLRIGRRIEDRDELGDLIIQRARLVQAGKTWYGVVVYRRPPSPSS